MLLLRSYLRRLRTTQLPASRPPPHAENVQAQLPRSTLNQTPARLQGATLLPLAASAGPEPPSAIVLLSILAGLPLALWTYKSTMMVLFQRRIIYMGYAPLGARTEKLTDPIHARNLEGIRCEEVQLLNPEDDVKLSGLLVTSSGEGKDPQVVVVYFQGNAGNPLHRLPVFQGLLRSSQTHSSTRTVGSVAILAVAPRSYWTSSKRRPTQSGILSDYRYAVNYATERFPDARIVLYGHSLGGAAAVCLLAEHDKHTRLQDPGKVLKDPSRVLGLVLENPFASIAGMVRALYPQRWVPYQYLTPFIYDRWDALQAVKDAPANDSASESPPSLLRRLTRSILVMVSENDEVVPPSMGEALFRAAADDSSTTSPSSEGVANTVPKSTAAAEGMSARLVTIPGALHENAWRKRTWEKEMTGFLARYK